MDIQSAINNVIRNIDLNRQDMRSVMQAIMQGNATPAQIALSWVLSHPEISVAISGADKEEQMKENVGALEIKLTDEQITDLNNKSKGLNLLGQF